MLKLSILICTIERRKHFLQRILSILEPQKTDEVEILIEKDNEELTIGAKRNKLLNRAQADYLVFCDDDDRVSDNYVSLILNAINKSFPDSIGMNLIMTVDKVIEERSFHSIKYDHWYDEPDPEKPWLKKYFRNPNHLNPVKRELALKVKFPEISMGEDKSYSQQLLQYLKTEEYIEEPIYFYDFISRK